MQKMATPKKLNTSLELFPIEALKKAPCLKGKIEDLKKEYYSIDDIEKLAQK